MALIKNQYGTFYTDKEYKTPRLPSNPELESLAQKLYGKKFDDLTINQRTNIRAGKFKKDPITFKQYLDDFKKMAEDPSYIPKYVKPLKGTGPSIQQVRARAEAKNTIENFQAKLNKNINRRKRLKRAADPIKKEKDLVAKAERKAKRRAGKKDVATTPRENKINLDQRAYARTLNKPIKDNPLLVLNDKE